MSIDLADSVDAPQAKMRSVKGSFIQRIWPLGTVAVGLILSAAWTGLLGYGFVKLVEFAI